MSIGDVERKFSFRLKSFSLKTHHVDAIEMGAGAWSIACRGDGYRVDVNIILGTFFLLSIRLDQRHRGKGIGEQLYRICEQIAYDLRCSEIRQTPSGWAYRGESRMEWLLRRGWRQDGCEAYRPLCGTVALAGE